MVDRSICKDNNPREQRFKIHSLDKAEIELLEIDFTISGRSGYTTQSCHEINSELYRHKLKSADSNLLSESLFDGLISSG